MIKSRYTQAKGLKKVHIKEMVLFAINYLPQLDQETLEQFLELVDVEDTYGYVSARELASKMQLMLRHIPEACPYSLQTLASLLDVQLQKPRSTAKLLKLGVFANDSTAKSFSQHKQYKL